MFVILFWEAIVFIHCDTPLHRVFAFHQRRIASGLFCFSVMAIIYVFDVYYLIYDHKSC